MPTVNHGNNSRPAPVSVGAKRPWKEITLAILGVSLFVSTFLVPYQSFLPAWRQYNNSYAINPGGSSSFSITPSLGSTVQFMLEVSGEGSLHLSTKNEENRTVVDQILSSGRYFFSIPSGSSVYSVSLENGGSSAQSIYWIVWMYYYNSTFQLMGITFAGLASFMLLAHRKNIDEEEVQTFAVPDVKENAEEDKKSPSPSDVVQQAKKLLEDLKD